LISNSRALVLSRIKIREADRLCFLYSEDHGKIMVRFIGAERPKGKLKGLSEPMVWGEYRLYHAPRGALWKGIGGAILSSFPAVRADVGRTLGALSCLELLSALSPLHSPNPVKYALALSALQAFERAESPWIATAFGLRVLAAAGLGIPRRPAECESSELWEALLAEDFSGLPARPFDAATDAALKGLIQSQAEEHSQSPLKSWGVAKRLAQFERRESAAMVRRPVDDTMLALTPDP
jgi:hypothetical protein